MSAPPPAAAATEFLLGWADTFENCGYDDMAGNIRQAATLLSEHDRLTEEVARLREREDPFGRLRAGDMSAPSQSPAAEIAETMRLFVRFPKGGARRVVQSEVEFFKRTADKLDAVASEHDRLTEEVARLREREDPFGRLRAGDMSALTADEKRALAAFAREVIRDAWLGGGDGGSVQDAAERLGLILRTVYDPERHGDGIEADAGDEIFVLADWLKAEVP